MQRSILAVTSLVGLLAIVFVLAPASVSSASAAGADPVCIADPDPPIYYAIDLVSTGKVPGARRADGIGNVTFASSPYGVAISPDGTYVYDLDISIAETNLAEGKTLSAWVTTPSLDEIVSIGHLGDDNHIRGRVEWNKFLVVITLEPSNSEPTDRWTGPIVSRGMSRSGLMHTMAGHGPFQTEPCAAYGYR